MSLASSHRSENPCLSAESVSDVGQQDERSRVALSVFVQSRSSFSWPDCGNPTTLICDIQSHRSLRARGIQNLFPDCRRGPVSGEPLHGLAPKQGREWKTEDELPVVTCLESCGRATMQAIVREVMISTRPDIWQDRRPLGSKQKGWGGA